MMDPDTMREECSYAEVTADGGFASVWYMARSMTPGWLWCVRRADGSMLADGGPLLSPHDAVDAARRAAA